MPILSSTPEVVPFEEVAAVLEEAASRVGGGPPAMIIASGRQLAGALEAAWCRAVRNGPRGPQLRLTL